MPRVDNPNAIKNSLPGFVKQMKDITDDIKSGSRNALFSLVVGLGGAIFNGAVRFLGGITGNVTATGAVSGSSVSSSSTVTAATDVHSATSSTTGTATIGGNANVAGDVFVPNSFAAVTGYTVGYINGDGRLSKGASAARFKQDFEPVDNAPLAEAMFRATLLRFHLIAAVEELGDGATLEIGLLADYLETIGLTEFVYRDENGEPLGIQYERLTIPLIAAVQNLDARLKAAGL